MKSTGIVRKIDSLGRVVIPVELRRTLQLAIGDPLEIFIDEHSIIFQKYSSGCVFCNSVDHVIMYQGKQVCQECIKKMDDMVK